MSLTPSFVPSLYMDFSVNTQKLDDDGVND